MKKVMKYLLAGAVTAFAVTSCWKDELPDASAGDFNRHQVENLTATPGDEEVLLEWEMPEGWNPTDFIVFYNTTDEVVTLTTDGAMRFTVDGLENETTYTFNVQAVYGELVSGAVAVNSTPTTSRIAVKDLKVVADNESVYLEWTKPSQLVQGYELSYYMADAPADVTKEDIGAEATNHTVSGLTNDKNYVFSLAAKYAKGNAEAVTARAMPTLAIPYFLSTEHPVKNKPITFTFNTEGYPTATDVKWAFPDGSTQTGNEISYGINATGEQTVKLTADIDGVERSWDIVLDLREYVVFFQDWTYQKSEGTGKWNGLNYTCPVFSPDGKTVYVNTGFAATTIAVHALDIDTGELKWFYEDAAFGGTAENIPTVNPVTGDIYFAGKGARFAALNPDGTLKWSSDDLSGGSDGAPAVSADGSTVFIIDNGGNVFAFDTATGSQKWMRATGAATSGCGLLVNGNDLVVGAETGIYFISVADGTIIETVTTGFSDGGLLNHTGFGVSHDKKTAYFSAGKNSALGALDLEGRKLIHATKVATDNCYDPVVGADGHVLCGTKSGHVLILDSDGKTILHDIDYSTHTFNFSRPCADADGNYYITAGGSGNNHMNLIISSDGKLVDEWQYEGDGMGEKWMFSQSGQGFLDGVFYSCLSGNQKDYGLLGGKYVGGQLYGYYEGSTEWMGCHGGDICGSCCIK